MIARNPEPVLQLVAERHGLLASDLLRRDQHRNVTTARKEAMRALRDDGWSPPHIAGVFGMDEASVRYALRGPRGPRQKESCRLAAQRRLERGKIAVRHVGAGV